MQRLSLLLLAICVSRGQGQTQHPPEFGGGLDGSAGSSSVVGTPDVSINQFDVTDKTKSALFVLLSFNIETPWDNSLILDMVYDLDLDISMYRLS